METRNKKAREIKKRVRGKFTFKFKIVTTLLKR